MRVSYVIAGVVIAALAVGGFFIIRQTNQEKAVESAANAPGTAMQSASAPKAGNAVTGPQLALAPIVKPAYIAPPPAPDSKAGQALAAAEAAAKKGDAAGAIAAYTQAIAAQPDFADSYYYRGTIYTDQKNYDLALADFTKAIALKPDAPSFQDRGVVYHRKGMETEAIADFSHAIELDPSDVGAFINRGAAFRRKGNIDSAINDYSTALQLEPSSAIAFADRGLAYIAKGDKAMAANDLNEALALDPNIEPAKQGLKLLGTAP